MRHLLNIAKKSANRSPVLFTNMIHMSYYSQDSFGVVHRFIVTEGIIEGVRMFDSCFLFPYNNPV
jgi:hypothetical protein